MTTSVETFKEQLKEAAYNPGMMLATTFDILRDITDGKIEIVDATNPVVFTIESAAVTVASFLEQNEASDRKRYAVLAQTEDDLYRHMSDKDYIDRFALPSKATFGFVFSKEELLQKMVFDETTGNRQLVIPRNTYVEVATTQFSLQYPIIIRQLTHGGIQVVYDTELQSPLLQLETNVIDWEYRNLGDETWLYFEVLLYQFQITSMTSPVDSSKAVDVTMSLPDQYYYTRAFMEDAQGLWQEIYTTHSQQVYDPLRPTAVLRVANGTLNIRIPQIYTSRQLVDRVLRFDLYTTKGVLNMDLGSYNPGTEMSTTWLAIDKTRDETKFVAPLKNFVRLGVMSSAQTLGGRDVLSIDLLRERVVNSAAGPTELPITPAQIQAGLEDAGYSIVRNIDLITDRAFLATRHLPNPINEKLITAAAASVETVSTTFNEAINQARVIDNGKSITFTPKVLYQSVKGVMRVVPQPVIDQILALTPDQRAIRVTNSQFYYTPFHYVLDTSNDEFAARPYYLDGPSAEMKIFISENDTTLLQVTSQQYLLERVDAGYRLKIKTRSSEAYQNLPDSELFVQLSYIPPGERTRAYLNGTLLAIDPDTSERIYVFDLGTNWNVTSDDYLELKQFKMFDHEDRIVPSLLTQTFDILYSTSAQMEGQWRSSSIDDLLGTLYLPTQIAGITHEQIRLHFGDALKTLWARARSAISDAEYARYPMDIKLFYKEKVYEINPATNSTIWWENGKPVFKTEHEQGDPVIDPVTGEQRIEFHKGDVILDPSGKPTLVNERNVLRQFDVLMIEGAYWFATDQTAVDYRAEMVKTLLSWMLTDLGGMKTRLLDKTRLFFYPKATMGEIEVMISAGGQATISAGQAFQVELYVDDATYSNTDLRNQLVRKTVQTLSNYLQNQVVSISDIVSALKVLYGSDVINVTVDGLGGGLKLPALTVLDDRNRCSVRKRLVAQPDDTLIVEEDVNVIFVRHVLKD